MCTQSRIVALGALAAETDTARRLQTMPGVGPLTAPTAEPVAARRTSGAGAAETADIGAAPAPGCLLMAAVSGAATVPLVHVRTGVMLPSVVGARPPT